MTRGNTNNSGNDPEDGGDDTAGRRPKLPNDNYRCSGPGMFPLITYSCNLLSILFILGSTMTMNAITWCCHHVTNSCWQPTTTWHGCDGDGSRGATTTATMSMNAIMALPPRHKHPPAPSTTWHIGQWAWSRMEGQRQQRGVMSDWLLICYLLVVLCNRYEY